MELRDRNLIWLENKYPGIKKIVEDKAQGLLEQEQMEVAEEQSYEGETILRVHRGQRQLYMAGKRNPSAHAVNQISVLGKIVPYAPVMILGMGNIHYFRELISKTDKSVVILVYEPIFTIFYEQLNLIDFEQIVKERLVVFVIGGINDDGLESVIHTMLKGDKIPLMKYFVLPNYVELCKDSVDKFINIILKDCRSYQMNIGTGLLFNPYQADNFYHNVKYFRTGYKAFQLLEVIPQNIPAIVISAGPSLNKNINELKKAKNHAFLIAVDTAIKPLLKAGIIPDMFATLDGRKPIELVSVEEARTIPLITLIIGSKELMEYHKGKKFFIDEGYDYVRELFGLNRKSIEGFATGGSVATLAFALVCHLGFRKIIFVGQDLAYTNNKTHADGTFEEKMQEKNTEGYLMVPGNIEETVPTISNLNSYRIWFEDYIEEWSESHYVQFINATEGGARIKGTDVMTLKEVVEQECTREVDIAACFEQLEPVFNKEEQARILTFFHDTPKRIQEIIRLAQDGKKLYQRLEKLCRSKNLDKTAYVKVLKKVKRNRKQIENNPNYGLLVESMTRAEQIIKSSQYFEYDTVQEEGLELARQGKLYMELLEEYAGILYELANDTVAKVE